MICPHCSDDIAAPVESMLADHYYYCSPEAFDRLSEVAKLLALRAAAPENER